MTLRERILEASDLQDACHYAERSCNAMTDALNSLLGTPRQLSNGTQIMVRILAAESMLQIAAAWLAELTKEPLPECAKAVRDLLDDPPPEIEGDVVKDEANAIEH